MQENKPFQLPLPTMGEGVNPHIMTDDRIARSLRNKAEETYRMIVHAKMDYERVKGDYDEMVKATHKKSHETWVMFKGDRWRYDAVKSMRDFVKDYPSMQCERIELLRALLASLSQRGVVITIDENILDAGSC